VAVGLLGPVYRGRYLPTGAEVHLEALPERLGADRAFLDRVAGMGRIASGIRDEGIVDFYDVLRTPEETIYLVSAPAEDPSLAAASPPGRGLPLDDTLAIGRQVLRALGVLHERGLFHGGVGRSTVLRDPQGRVRLCAVPAAAALAAWAAAEAADGVASDLAATARLLEGLLADPLAGDGPHHPPRRVQAALAKARRQRGYPSADAMAQALARARTAAPRRPAAVLAPVAVVAGVVLGLAVNALLSPAGGSLTVRSLSVDVSPGAAPCDATLSARAAGTVAGHGNLVYRWDVSGGRSTGNEILPIGDGTGTFSVSQRWRPTTGQGPASISFEVVQPAHLVVTRTVGQACAG
jgi:serine/threonine protein kinase